MFLVICIGLVVYKKEVFANKLLITKVLNQIPSFVRMVREIQKCMEKNGDDPKKINLVDAVADECERLATLLGIAIDGKTGKIIRMLTLAYYSEAHFKKDITIDFYNVLEKTDLKEEKCDHLVYIFNRFIGEMLRNPYRALLNGAYRFYKYLRHFGYIGE